MPWKKFDLLPPEVLDDVAGSAVQTVVSRCGKELSDAEREAVVEIVTANLLAAAADGQNDPVRLKELAVEGITHGWLLH